MKSTLRLFVLTALAAIGASAGVISIALDVPDQIALPGQTVTFSGVITHVGNPDDADIYLNADSLDFTMTGATLIDNFFANVPLFLGPGASSGPIDLFDIVLGIEPGTYAGSYQLIGGEDEGANTALDNLAQANFTVTVPTPEPGTLGLWCAGLPLIWWGCRARRVKSR